jgi:uncharacterized protein YdeI (YjbR/CyaY-like superfamily)
MATPVDFMDDFTMHPTALDFFNGLNKTERFAVLMQLATVSDKSRSKKIALLVQNMTLGKTL